MTPISTMNIGGEQVQYFGWVPREVRTAAEQQADQQIIASLPTFQIDGHYKGDKEKVALYEARQKISKTQHPAYVHQSTGSCVGAGGCNALMTLRDVEIALKGEAEEPQMVWWPYTYGESRELSGMRGRGDGSTGSGWAKAATTKGFVADTHEELPKYEMRQGWYYLSNSIEMQWSDGRVNPEKWDSVAKENLVKTAAKANSSEDVAAGIHNGYPATVACMFGTRGPKRLGDGDNAVMVAEWDASWAHQQMIDAYWDHPTLGVLFRIGNSWSMSAHPPAVDGSPNGGYWVRKSVVDRMCRDEVFIISNFVGYPARELNWDIV